VTKWEQFEEYLFERDLLGESFNQPAVVQDLGVSGKDASRYIQCYLDAQVRPKSRTLFVLHREPKTRTKSAMWHVGERTLDTRNLGRQWADDAKRRVDRFIIPALRRVAVKQPRSLRAAEAVAKGIEASIDLMTALLED
jgi:hypothetical protein